MSGWPTIGLVILAFGSLTSCNPAQRAKEAQTEIASGNAAACTQERSTIEKAVQTYTFLNPDSPISEAAMVTDGFIVAESVLMDVASDGTVVPAPGTACA